MNKQTDEVGLFQKRICFWAMSSALVLAVVLLILSEKNIAKGILLGTCFSILNFLLLGRFTPLTLGQSRTKARFISLASILSRYFILALPMILAVKLNAIDLTATVIGIFAVQIVTIFKFVVLEPFFTRR